jgi:hypothetical protein
MRLTTACSGRASSRALILGVVAETPESIAARLEGVKGSRAKIRLTLGTMAIVSVMMVITAYNAYLSYDYTWITDPKERGRVLHDELAPDILTSQALKDWAASRNVQISLLGIRVSIDDAAILGSAVLFVLSLWLLLLARQEYHIIGSLLRDTDTPRPNSSGAPSTMRPTESQPCLYSSGERWLIFHTIISNSLFFTFDHLLSSVHSLDDQDPLKTGAPGASRGRLTKAGLKLLRNFFFLFPVITSFVIFGLDRWSYFIPDPFEPSYAIPGIGPFFWWSLAVFFVCWIPLAICCWRSSRYSRVTKRYYASTGIRFNPTFCDRSTPRKIEMADIFFG